MSGEERERLRWFINALREEVLRGIDPNTRWPFRMDIEQDRIEAAARLIARMVVEEEDDA